MITLYHFIKTSISITLMSVILLLTATILEADSNSIIREEGFINSIEDTVIVLDGISYNLNPNLRIIDVNGKHIEFSKLKPMDKVYIEYTNDIYGQRSITLIKQKKPDKGMR